MELIGRWLITSYNLIIGSFDTGKENHIARLHGLQPEQLARIGLFYLEEAVLDVLYEVVHSDNDQETWLTTAKISKRLEIPASDTGVGYPLVRYILDKLLSEARVQRRSLDRGGARYRLTKEEREKRCDESRKERQYANCQD